MRQAIEDANDDNTDPIDEIIFNLPAGQDTIELDFGELLISDSVIITGPGVTIDAGDGTDGVFGTGDGHRVFQIVGNSEVTLSGLTLTGGDVSPSEYFPKGGAILANDEFNGDDITLTLNEMVLEGNYAEQGGALQMGVDMSDAVSSLQINGSTLTGNESEDLGGAVVVAASAATFFETVVSDNAVRFVSPTRGTSSPDLGSGGGVAVVSGLSTTTFISSIVANNTSGHHGGGVYTQNSGPGKELVILDSSIYGNTAQFDGGGVYHCPKAGGDFMMANATVSENVTAAIDGRGGGVFLGAESRTDFTSIFNASIHNTTVARNTSRYGGGVYGYIGLGEFGNPASIDLTMHNSIVALNQDHSLQPNDLDAEFVPASGNQDTQLFETDSSHNLLGAVSSVLSAELLLANDNLKNQTQVELQLGDLGYYGGFHSDFYSIPILPISSAFDAGDNMKAIDPSDGSDLLTDQRGGYFMRLYTQFQSQANATVDIGAYERSAPGDYNRDGVVDAADYTVWRDALGGTVAIPFDAADGDGDGAITQNDYNVWADNYSGSLRFLGDFNGDGVVDAADYTVWRDTLDDQVVAGTGADANNDGVIDFEDYAIWKGHYGTSWTVAPDPARLLALASFLAGDLNEDGVVDYDDYLHWETVHGSVVPKATGADFNADGVIDLNDLYVWQQEHTLTSFPDLAGDFDGNGVVGSEDWDLWNAGSPLADGNQDGVVDALDLDMWTAYYGKIHASAWPTLTNVVGGGNPIASGVSQVVGIVAEASGGAHDLGALVGSGEQLRSVPLTGVDRISLTFSEQVLVTTTDLLLTNLDSSGAGPVVTGLEYDLETDTATWTFSSTLSDGRYLLRLNERLRSLDDEAIDGDFENPWMLAATNGSVLPSGDGDAGGEFRFRFTVLAGDSDRDNIDGATDYTNWKSYEPGMIYVSTTVDEWDSDLSFGDVSLREAVDHANSAAGETLVYVPEGDYALTRMGVESGDASYNDLDITGNVTILGVGAGVTNIVGYDQSYTGPFDDFRTFEVEGPAARLRIQGVTMSGADSIVDDDRSLGFVISAESGAELQILDSVVTNNRHPGVPVSYGGRGAVYARDSDVTILRSVFSGNDGLSGVAVTASNGSLTVGDSIFALNTALTTVPNIRASGVTATNLGNNLYDSASGGFFDTTPGVGDHLGTPDYVVTTVADTFDHTDNDESLSIREAVDLANQNAGQQEVWLPAWDFQLTRDRQTYGGGSTTDTDIAYGDLDITDSLIVRGVSGRTNVAWEAGIVDEVFDLVGDAATWQQSEDNVDSTDLWAIDFYRNYGFYDKVIDVDDDGDIDQDDYDLAFANQGNSLDLFDIAVG